MNNDPIADLLTRIRNASQAGLPSTELPWSRIKADIVRLLQAEGYVRSFEVREEGARKTLRVNLKYDAQGYPLIRKIKRESRPGLRRYAKVDNIPRILSGAGTVIVSTSQGVMTDRDARSARVGGEILCTVY